MTALNQKPSRKHCLCSRLAGAAAMLLMAMQLTSCSSALNWENGTSGPSSDSAGANNSVQMPAGGGLIDAPAELAGQHYQAAQTATEMIGVPYRYGGSSPKAGFDCSGLVQYSYSQAGMRVPRTSRAQFKAARPISLAEAQPGDLLFFRYKRKVSHVAIYLGDDRFVHAPSSGKQVSVASLRDPHYQQHFLQAGRLQ